MTKKYHDEYATETGGSTLLKTIVIGAIGTVASYYVTMWAKRMLEEKPLKTRLREGRERAAQMRSTAMDKAANLRSTAKARVDKVAEKTKSLIDEKADQVEYDALKAELKTEEKTAEVKKLIDGDNKSGL